MKFQYTCLEKPKPEAVLREIFLKGLTCPEKILGVSSKAKQICSQTLQRRGVFELGSPGAGHKDDDPVDG